MLIYLFCENCNPPEKSHPPLSQELLFKILSKVQPPPQQKGGGGVHSPQCLIDQIQVQRSIQVVATDQMPNLT